MSIGGWSFRGFNTRFLLLFAVIVAGLGAWLGLPEPSDAQNTPIASPAPGAEGAPKAAVLDADQARPLLIPVEAPADAAMGVSAMEAAVERSPLDGLKISSQSWRRGGLGSKALVTFTLRNGNDYAVKDIEIACAFARRDGSHLTDRKRVISDTINMRSRKTYAKVLVGFVNVNADKAKCSLVTASRT